MLALGDWILQPFAWRKTMEATRAALTLYKSQNGDLNQVYQSMCLDITRHVGSTRASVWLLTPLQDAIECLCLHDTRDKSFHSGSQLREEDFGDYFQAIKKDLKIIADDASSHSATKCFDEIYFIPNDIRSLLDFVVLKSGAPIGVLCCEHCTQIKRWSESDIQYLHQMSSLLAMTVTPGEKALRKAA
jgi:GAF domain-containing protein